ncbi:YslB family protein [Shouchella clausii]|uniref:YslB family protein n=1 Tax=Shouchella clausii TaxID=79880 RepID=UPI000BA4EBBF|nr:YslB family protein [Shouchella clausii]PAD18882.1 hypothetical protein CHH73_03555 [Shouchella clausii]
MSGEDNKEQTAGQYGYDLIRNDILRTILGDEHDRLLYWVGKKVARDNPLESVEELISFFQRAEWGQLQRLKEKRSEYIFELTGDWMGRKDRRCYQLEAGFLAETFEVWHEVTTAVTYTQKRNSTIFTVHFDRNDPVNVGD